MNSRIRSTATAVAVIVCLAWTTARVDASYYGLVIGQTTYRPDQVTFDADATAVANGLKNRTAGGHPYWEGYAEAGHLKQLSGGDADFASFTGALTALNVAMAGDDDAHFLMYYSGHSGKLSSWENPLAPGDQYDEFSVLKETAVPGAPLEGFSDDTLHALVMANLPRAKHHLFIMDTCFAGGYWGGRDQGDLDKIATSALIGAALETEKAPLDSMLTLNFTRILNAGGKSWTAADLGAKNGTGIGYGQRQAVTGGRRDQFNPGDLAGEGNDWDEDITGQNYESFYDARPGVGGTTFLQSVPEPASLALLFVGGLASLRRRHPGA